LPADARIKLWFAVAKAWNDTEQYDRAIAAYHKGNRLNRQTFTYDSHRMGGYVSDLVQRFNAEQASRTGGHADGTPIFILGMPRSGTTLIEQILSSHPHVHGAGELKDFSDSFHEIAGSEAGTGYMDWLISARPNDLETLGRRYVERLRAKNSKATFITDKMPGNFFMVGLIHLALPNARIVHARRDPMDTCLSNYQILYNEPMPYAYDLSELGQYYRDYDRLMRHWETVLPPGRVHTLQYETLVDDIEAQARELLHYVGLEWDDTCLEFHQNRRVVKTASVSQVRQPLYRTSAGKWKHYAPWLTELSDSLNHNHGTSMPTRKHLPSVNQ
jgi:hypothetical protein